MKTKTNIFIAFLLNFFFSIFEFIGGIFTGSVAILSDAVHDFGDAISIGFSFFFEKISNKQPNQVFTFGYARFSVLGGLLTTVILIMSSCFVVYSAILRIISPTIINYDGMLIFAVVGLIVNLIATYFTHGGKSINQKAVNLHMLEDVLGWFVVLIGAIIIRFTHLYLLDPILSIIVAVFILVNCIKNLFEIINIFLIKTPKNICVDEIIKHLKNIQGVKDVHHLHFWTTDGQNVYSTLHVVCSEYDKTIKDNIKNELSEHGVFHTTIEIELETEVCLEKTCIINNRKTTCCHHHC